MVRVVLVLSTVAPSCLNSDPRPSSVASVSNGGARPARCMCGRVSHFRALAGLPD